MATDHNEDSVDLAKLVKFIPAILILAYELRKMFGNMAKE